MANSELASRDVNALGPPAKHGQWLVSPPPSQWAEEIQHNKTVLESVDPSVGGRRLSRIRAEAKREVLRAAIEYTLEYTDLDSRHLEATDIAPPPLMMAGHQPELYHPGVWIKNFLLSTAAERLGGIAINMIVDNDISGTIELKVPRRGSDGFEIDHVVLDPRDPTIPAIPFEERHLATDSPFWGIDREIVTRLDGLVADPLARCLWDDARRELRAFQRPGRLIPAMRHRLEWSHGLRTLEIPTSKIATTTAFGHCLTEWLHRAEALREIHNRCLLEYRQRHRIRSRSHPVPELAAEEGVIEIPFWIWSSDAPTRRRAFRRIDGDDFLITDRDQLALRLPRKATGDAWSNASGGPIRVRPRALTTTMVARVFLSDLFIHGIGGGKYDQLTDAFIREAWGIEPPTFVTASATFLLPIDVDPSLGEQIAELERLLRDVKYHPENHADSSDPQIQSIVQRKREWLAGHDRGASGKQHHQAIAQCNRELLKHLAAYRSDLQSRLQRLKQQWEQHQWVLARDFSLCLHPESLPAQLQQTASEAFSTI